MFHLASTPHSLKIIDLIEKKVFSSRPIPQRNFSEALTINTVYRIILNMLYRGFAILILA